MRLCRLSSLFVTVVLAVLVAPAAPASAAAAPRLNTALDPITISPDTPEDTYSAHLYGLLAQHEEPARPHRITYTVDLTEVADLVKLTFDSVPDIIAVAAADETACKLRGTIFHCLRTGVRPVAGRIVELGLFTVDATSNAQIGDTGQIKVTARVDDGPVTTSTSPVQIGESVDLATLSSQKVSATPGGTVRVSPRVRNVGSATVRGAVLLIGADRKLLVTDASNCFYGDQTYCVFETALAPKQTYALRTALTLRTPADAAPGSRADIGLSWLTPAQWENEKKMFSIQGKPGGGAALKLVSAASAAEIPQVDVNADNDDGSVLLTVAGARRPALAAFAPAVTLAPGRTATMRFGITNDGPGALYPALFSNTTTFTRLTLPKGVSVTRADKRCSSADARQWFCSPAGTKLPAGRATVFVFRLTAAKSFTGGSGQVQVEGDLINSTRKLRIGVPTRGAGGGLAVSGPAVWPGVLLVVLGAALMRVGRRRS